MDKSEERNEGDEAGGGFGLKGLKSDVLDRFREAVHAAGGNQVVAQRSGVPLSTVNKAVRGETQPRAQAMAAMVMATGRSMDWIFFGGTAAPQPAGALLGVSESGRAYVSSPADEGAVDHEVELHGRIVDTIVRVAKEVGASIPPVDLGRRAVEIHRELGAATMDHAERLAMLKLLAVQLKKEMVAPPANPAQSQSQARKGSA